MTAAAASSGAGWLPVVLVLGLAFWASARRRRRARPSGPRSAPKNRPLRTPRRRPRGGRRRRQPGYRRRRPPARTPLAAARYGRSSSAPSSAAGPGAAGRHGARRGLGAAGHPGFRAAVELQGVARAGSARHRSGGLARPTDAQRGRTRQRLQRGRLRRARLVHLRPRLRRHRRLQPRCLHRHVDGQPVAERGEVRRRRGELVALPHRRRREGARPARQPHQPGHPRHVQRRVHHLGRARAADPRRSAVRAGDAR